MKLWAEQLGGESQLRDYRKVVTRLVALATADGDAVPKKYYDVSKQSAVDPALFRAYAANDSNLRNAGFRSALALNAKHVLPEEGPSTKRRRLFG